MNVQERINSLASCHGCSAMTRIFARAVENIVEYWQNEAGTDFDSDTLSQVEDLAIRYLGADSDGQRDICTELETIAQNVRYNSSE